jgi:CubicO group peptidase (beta-lactamase class C family)
MALLLLMISGCRDRDPDRANYKYFTSSWQGTNVYADRYDGAILKSRRLIKEAGKWSGLPGAQIVVAVDGEIRWSENFGFANLEQGGPVKSNSLFRIASTSKVLTAAAVAKLVEQDKLHLDTPVIKYLPTLPEHYSDITMRHLVSHQSGIRHYYGADRSEKTEHFDDVNDALKLFTDAPLLFEPGQHCEYSSYAWVVASAVIQKLSGKPFLQFMKEEVWDPIGMKNTFGTVPGTRSNDITKFYLKNSPEGSWREAPYQDLSFNWAGAGFTSNANDLALYGNALLNGTLLKKETVDMLFTPQVTLRKDTTGFGIGFTSYYTRSNERIIGHSGFMPTGRSYLLLFPESNVVIAYVSNTAMTNFADENLVAIAHHFIKEKSNENYFISGQEHNRSWTGLWHLEIEQNEGNYDTAYLHVYEDKHELRGTLLFNNMKPAEIEIIFSKTDTLEFLAPLPSHTATITLTLTDEGISGNSYFDKPLTYQFKKLLTREPEIRKMLTPKRIKNGYKITK